MANDGGKNKNTTLVGVSNSLFLVVMVIAMAVGVNGFIGGGATGAFTPNKEVKVLCHSTDYEETCENALAKAGTQTSDPRELNKAGYQYIVDEIKSAMTQCSTWKVSATDPRTKKALDDCGVLMDYAIDDLLLTFDRVANKFDLTKVKDYVEDLKIWLSGALTYQETCIDGFENATGDIGKQMTQLLKMSKEMTANAIDMVVGVSTFMNPFGFQLPSLGRRLLTDETNQEEEPSWVNHRRGLLQAKNIKADAVVAKDGSGKFKTITQALQAAPKNSIKTFVIHIKAGVYKEKVMVDKTMTHIMMIGDGPTKTKITGSLNFADGTPTFETATFSVIGSNFVGKDIGFENTAGPAKHQAVALRVQSDMSIFYNCQMDGYQDTLYIQTHRQFYRDCTITGTVDFIFGNAAAVFQNCKLLVRKPMGKQQCIVTAQGRLQRTEPTATILQNCVITSAPDFLPVRRAHKVYLGRPWKEYSRTIIMQSQIDDLIQPEGWTPWKGDFALNTLFYAEINNKGPGAAKDKRVKWGGIKQITPQQAADFTPGSFLRGTPWIKASGVPYEPGMMKG